MSEEVRKPRTSISRIDTFAACARYDYYQVVEKVLVPSSPYQDEGVAIHEIVESQFSADPSAIKPLLGASVKVMSYYPIPGQPGVEIERKFEAAPYAGALLFAKIDCYAPPGTLFGESVRRQKRDLHRVIDLKTTKSKNVRYKEDPSLLDENRQLLAYTRIRRPDDPLIEISQVVVGRDAPHLVCGPVRIVSRQQAVDQEGYDSEIVTRMVASRKAVSALDLPPADVSKCGNWYGKKCDFYDRCYGGVKSGADRRSWSDILTAADQDGRGGEGTRAALDQAVRDTNPNSLTWDRFKEIADGYGAPVSDNDITSLKATFQESLPALPSRDDPFWSDPAPTIATQKNVVGEFVGDFWFLSNFYPCLFYPGIGLSVEHLYQALKSDDPDDIHKVMFSGTPSAAKRVGRTVKLRDGWDNDKVLVMTELLRMKFKDADLRSRLLSTGGAELVEGNTWGDKFWGVDIRTGEGQNELGKALMRVRQEIRLNTDRPTTVDGESRDDLSRRFDVWARQVLTVDTNNLAHELVVTTITRVRMKKAMSLINPQDANQNHTSKTLEFEDHVQVLHDTYQGKPYTSIIGERHGQPWEFRALLDDWKFLVGGEIYSATKNGKEIKKIKDGVLKSTGTVTMSAGGIQYIDLIRTNALHHQLLAWDLEVSPPTAETTSAEAGAGESASDQVNTHDDLLSEIESQQSVTNSTASNLDASTEIAKLISAGCTESQAQKMVGAGITDARLRAGSVTQQELEALPKFGPARAEAILSRYGKAKTDASSSPQTTSEKKTIVDVALESGKMVVVHVGDDVEKVVESTTEQQTQKSDTSHKAGYTLYIDCIVAKGGDSSDFRPASLDYVLKPYLDKIAADRNVVDILCLKAFEWPGLLVEALHANPPSDTQSISVRSTTKEWDAVRRFFVDRARFIVRGV